MMRRLILAALALFAFLSLESCGISRIAGPAADRSNTQTTVENRQPAPVGQGDQGQNEQPIEGRN